MSSVRAALGAVVVYTAVAVALTWPLAANIAHVVPNDPGDPLLSTFLLWWNTQHVPFTEAWWNAPFFFPSPETLAFSEHFFGLSLFTTPIIWATGNPQLAYNIAFLLTFVLSGLGAHALGYVLTGRHDAALIAGLVYAFAPYRVTRFAHLHVLASFWMPVALAALHRYLQDPRARWLVCFAVAATLQGVTSGQYALFFPVLLGIWALWYVVGQRRWSAAGPMALAFVLAMLPIGAVLLHYAAVHRAFGFARDGAEIVSLSADITALVRADPNLRVWGGILPTPAVEAHLFPGLTIVVLVIAGVLAGRRRAVPAAIPASLDRWRWLRHALLGSAILLTIVTVALPLFGAWQVELFGAAISVRRISRPLSVALLLWAIWLAQSRSFRASLRSPSPLPFYVLGTLVMWLLAFGPGPTFLGERVLYWAPYRWLMLLPGFDGLRVPARFAMLAMLCLAAAGSIAFARLAMRLPARLVPILTVAVAVGVVADGWIRGMPLVPMPSPSILTAASEPGAVLELPLGEVDVAAMYRGMTHHHPVVNGYSGYMPAIWSLLRSGFESLDPEMPLAAARLGVRHIVVMHADAERTAAWKAYAEQTPGVRLVAERAGQTHYTIDAPAARPVVAVGATIPIAAVETVLAPENAQYMWDGDPDTVWATGKEQGGGPDETLIVKLEGVARVAGIRLALGRFADAYPRALRIERSFDCATWVPVWQGPLASIAAAGALATPRSAPFDVTFDAVDASCLAIRQTGQTPKSHWIVAELSVLWPGTSP